MVPLPCEPEMGGSSPRCTQAEATTDSLAVRQNPAAPLILSTLQVRGQRSHDTSRSSRDSAR